MLREYIEAVVIAMLISFLLITFVIQAFYIPSGSMRPLLEPGDRIFANKFIYRFRDPDRKEVVVFRYPVEPQHNFIKRVIGLPGDKVKIKEGEVYLNGETIKEEYKLEAGYTNFPEVEVPDDNYFVLGDNRNNSEDSRYWGFVPRENIIGQAFVIFWPPNRMSLIGSD